MGMALTRAARLAIPWGVLMEGESPDLYYGPAE